MERTPQAILFLLIGAGASGLGAAFFLFQANTDRSALVARAEEAQHLAAEATRSSKAVADEANRKLETAAAEVTKAKARVAALEEEREWLAKAQVLTPSRNTTLWKEWLNYTLGFTVKLPTTVTTTRNNAAGLDAGWFVVRKYTDESFTLDTAYAVKDHLLLGSKSETAWVFRAQSSGIPTHLIYVYPSPRVTERMILDALATLSFRNDELVSPSPLVR